MNTPATPRISIIVPVLNEPRIGRALDSILAQEQFESVELIVIDGGSNRPTLDEIEKRRDSISKFVSEPDSGIYNGMNKGIALADGEIIGILNADDRYADFEALDRVLAAFEDSAIGACYSDMIYVDDNGATTRKWIAGESSRLGWHFGWMPPHPTFFVRKSVYKNFGNFRQDFSISADYELMLRLALRNRVQYRYIPYVNVVMAPGGYSTRNVRNIVKANIEVSRAWRVNHLSGGILVPLLKPFRKLFQLAR